MLRFFFFFQAEDGIRDLTVTGVQTCALPISQGDGTGAAARAPDEGLRCRVAVGSEEADDLFHGRAARRFSRAGARPRRPVPHPDRAAADRRARRGEAAGRRGPLRAPVLLFELAPRAAAGQPRARQGSTLVAQSVADLGRVWAPAVLPALRARLLRADPQALSQRGEGATHRRGTRAGPGRGHLPRDRDAPL